MAAPVRHLAYALTLVLLILALGTLTYHNLEDWSYVEALYFTTSTLTTVGYGDLHPTSDLSRLVTVVFMLVGIGVVLYSLSSLGAHFTAHRIRALEEIMREGALVIRKAPRIGGNRRGRRR